MSVSVEKDRIVLSGHASIEDAERLLAALCEHPGHPVDILRLSRAHLAVAQLLHASGRTLLGPPPDPFLHGQALAGLTVVEPS